MSVPGRIMKEMQKHASDVVVIMEKSQHDLVKFANNQISVTKSWKNQEAMVFAAIKKRTILANIKEFSDGAIERSVKKIARFAKNLQPNNEYEGIAKGPFAYKRIPDTFDVKLEKLKEKSIDIVERGITTAVEEGAKRTAGVFETESEEVQLLTSNGCEGREKGTGVYFSIRALGDKDASGHKIAVARMMKHIDVEKTAQEAAQIARDARNPKKGVPGKYDVVFETLPAANLLENFGNNFSITNIETAFSCLEGALNKKAVSPFMTLIDDGALPNGMRSSKFDSEGVPSKRNVLVENGVIKRFLHNTSTAKRYKTETTASAGIISPEPRNLILQPGQYTKDELIEQVKDGLYITNVWYTRFQNYRSGDFSTIPRDGIFRIKKGRVLYPVKNIRISENILRLMRDIKAIGNSPEQVRGWEVDSPVITPQIMVKGVRITKPIEAQGVKMQHKA